MLFFLFLSFPYFVSVTFCSSPLVTVIPCAVGWTGELACCAIRAVMLDEIGGRRNVSEGGFGSTELSFDTMDTLT